ASLPRRPLCRRPPRRCVRAGGAARPADRPHPHHFGGARRAGPRHRPAGPVAGGARRDTQYPTRRHAARPHPGAPSGVTRPARPPPRGGRPGGLLAGLGRRGRRGRGGPAPAARRGARGRPQGGGEGHRGAWRPAPHGRGAWRRPARTPNPVRARPGPVARVPRPRRSVGVAVSNGHHDRPRRPVPRAQEPWGGGPSGGASRRRPRPGRGGGRLDDRPRRAPERTGRRGRPPATPDDTRRGSDRRGGPRRGQLRARRHADARGRQSRVPVATARGPGAPVAANLAPRAM
ncbi:MAG: hypothetical protein AVDCRST_MAG11-3047, partial [uncultured Gemmatimonadaceae bacterium]